MTKHTFTIDGQKYELVPHDITTGTSQVKLTTEMVYALKPIPKAVGKNIFDISVQQRFSQNHPLGPLYTKTLELSETQAQAIADMLNAAIEYVADPDDVKAETAPYTWVKFERLVIAARAAMQKEDA